MTTGAGKFYSNGLDLDYMMSSDDPPTYLKRVLDVMATLKRGMYPHVLEALATKLDG